MTALGIDVEQLEEIARLLVCFFVRRNLTDTPPTRDLTRLFMATIDKVVRAVGRSRGGDIRDELLAVSASDETSTASWKAPSTRRTSGSRGLCCVPWPSRA